MIIRFYFQSQIDHGILFIFRNGYFGFNTDFAIIAGTNQKFSVFDDIVFRQTPTELHHAGVGKTIGNADFDPARFTGSKVRFIRIFNANLTKNIVKTQFI